MDRPAARRFRHDRRLQRPALRRQPAAAGRRSRDRHLGHPRTEARTPRYGGPSSTGRPRRGRRGRIRRRRLRRRGHRPDPPSGVGGHRRRRGARDVHGVGARPRRAPPGDESASVNARRVWTAHLPAARSEQRRMAVPGRHIGHDHPAARRSRGGNARRHALRHRAVARTVRARRGTPRRHHRHLRHPAGAVLPQPDGDPRLLGRRPPRPHDVPRADRHGGGRGDGGRSGRTVVPARGHGTRRTARRGVSDIRQRRPAPAQGTPTNAFPTRLRRTASSPARPAPSSTR